MISFIDIFFYILYVYFVDKGFANWTEVNAIVFQYIRMLEAKGPQEWIFKEIKQLGDIYYSKYNST